MCVFRTFVWTFIELNFSFKKDREGALEVKRSMEASGCNMSSVSLLKLGVMEARLKNLDEAMKYKNFL